MLTTSFNIPLFVLLLVVANLILVVGQGGMYYEVDVSQSYVWGKDVPQSCVCKQTGGTPTSCSYFQCTCTCDLEADVCDYGCCCDPDCSPAQVELLCYPQTPRTLSNKASSIIGREVCFSGMSTGWNRE